jgi:hypothetical protein
MSWVYQQLPEKYRNFFMIARAGKILEAGIVTWDKDTI